MTVVISHSSVGLCNPKLFRMCPLILNLAGLNPQVMLVFQVLVDNFNLILMKIWVNILILLRLMRLKLLVLLLRMLLRCNFKWLSCSWNVSYFSSSLKMSVFYVRMSCSNMSYLCLGKCRLTNLNQLPCLLQLMWNK